MPRNEDTTRHGEVIRGARLNARGYCRLSRPDYFSRVSLRGEEGSLLEILKDELVHVLAAMGVLHEIDPDSPDWDDMRAQVEHLQHLIAAIERAEIAERKLH